MIRFLLALTALGTLITFILHRDPVIGIISIGCFLASFLEWKEKK